MTKPGQPNTSLAEPQVQESLAKIISYIYEKEHLDQGERQRLEEALHNSWNPSKFADLRGTAELLPREESTRGGQSKAFVKPDSVSVTVIFNAIFQKLLQLDPEIRTELINQLNLSDTHKQRLLRDLQVEQGAELGSELRY